MLFNLGLNFLYYIHAVDFMLSQCTLSNKPLIFYMIRNCVQYVMNMYTVQLFTVKGPTIGIIRNARDRKRK